MVTKLSTMSPIMGARQFFTGMESLLTSEKPIHADYDLGIFMLNRLPKNQASTLLEKRIDFLETVKGCS